jgi:hypothetical protein
MLELLVGAQEKLCPSPLYFSMLMAAENANTDIPLYVLSFCLVHTYLACKSAKCC